MVSFFFKGEGRERLEFFPLLPPPLSDFLRNGPMDKEGEDRGGPAAGASCKTKTTSNRRGRHKFAKSDHQQHEKEGEIDASPAAHGARGEHHDGVEREVDRPNHEDAEQATATPSLILKPRTVEDMNAAAAVVESSPPSSKQPLQAKANAESKIAQPRLSAAKSSGSTVPPSSLSCSSVTLPTGEDLDLAALSGGSSSDEDDESPQPSPSHQTTTGEDEPREGNDGKLDTAGKSPTPPQVPSQSAEPSVPPIRPVADAKLERALDGQEPTVRNLIMAAIGVMKSRKARPDTKRICNWIHRRYGRPYMSISEELERLVTSGELTRVDYKGSVSFRINAPGGGEDESAENGGGNAGVSSKKKKQKKGQKDSGSVGPGRPGKPGRKPGKAKQQQQLGDLKLIFNFKLLISDVPLLFPTIVDH